MFQLLWCFMRPLLLTSSLLTSFFFMAFWAAAFVATRKPSAASRSLCCWSSFSGLAAAPWQRIYVKRKKNLTDTAHNTNSEQRSASELQQLLSTAVRNITTTFCLISRYIFSVSSQIILLTRQLMFPKCKFMISVFHTIKQLANSDRSCLQWSTDDALMLF